VNWLDEGPWRHLRLVRQLMGSTEKASGAWSTVSATEEDLDRLTINVSQEADRADVMSVIDE
jgi:hypothetical protein